MTPLTQMYPSTQLGIESPARWSASPADPVLHAEEIHFFAFSLDPPTRCIPDLERLLAGDERSRAERFFQGRDRRRYVVGRAQLRTILGRYLGRDPRSLEFHYGTHGKPALRGRGEEQRVRFSLSRSHDLGVVAIQLDDDLGVDVERLRSFPDALDIAKRFFAPKEHEALRALRAADRAGAFFRYWTRKEAVVKSLGLGLSQPMDAFVLAPPPGPAVERIVIAGADGGAIRWSLAVPPPSVRYAAAIATAGGPHGLHCWAWRDQPPGH